MNLRNKIRFNVIVQNRVKHLLLNPYENVVETRKGQFGIRSIAHSKVSVKGTERIRFNKYIICMWSCLSQLFFCACSNGRELQQVIPESSNYSETEQTMVQSVDSAHCITEIVSQEENISNEVIVQKNEQVVLEEEMNAQIKECRLVMVGDILLHDRVIKSCLSENGEYDFSSLFAHTKDTIWSADVALVNQEVILGGEELRVSGYPNFNAPYEVGDALVEAGFDIVCHATNHALDRNGSGVQNCVNFWEERYPDILVTGIHDDQESAEEIPVLEVNGIKIAILNYTYGTNGIALPNDMPYAVDLLSEAKVIEDIQRAEEMADFTICCPHWGTEYRLSKDSMQVKWTDLFVKNGVDLVIGTHPHVIEPVEWIEDEESGNRMLVYYSLGNFVNWTSGTGAGTSNRMLGGMADVKLRENAEGVIEVSDYTVHALVSHVEDGYSGVSTYFLSDYAEDMAEQNQIRLQDSDFSYAYLVDLCHKIWGDNWD